MQLHFRISRGSGYDVACATASKPMIYELIDDMPVTESVDFSPPFAGHLYFVYLGEKQRSDTSIKSFLKEYNPTPEDIEYFSQITYKILNAKTLDQFCTLLHEHENRLSVILKQPTLAESRFRNLNGTAKSLGAWGGDFALIATAQPEEALRQYLAKQHMNIIFPFKEIVYDGHKL